METSSEETGIRIYTTAPAPQFKLPPLYPSPPPPQPVADNAPAAACGLRRGIMAKSVHKTLSKTSLLANFLPTGTLLTFEMLLPSIYGKGQCSHVATHMIYALLGMCTASCFFFHFTDSFRGPDGTVYYGFVTPTGLAVFKTGLGMQVPDDKRYRMGLSDFVHAIMSVLVFMAIALSDHRVTGCMFPGHKAEVDEVMESFPLMVGIICSGLFLLFPNTRFGIGCGSP